MPVDTVPSTLAMAEEAGCRHRKRQSTDQSISSWCQEVCTRKRQERDRGWSPKSLEVYATLIEAVNRRKKQKRNQGRSPKSTEWYRAMRVELNAKPFDPLTTDQSDVENELQSGSSILVLESTLSRHSHCRALFCL